MLMMYGYPKPKKQEKKNRCKVRIRKKPDGTVERSMENCTLQEAKVLMGTSNEIQENE